MNEGFLPDENDVSVRQELTSFAIINTNTRSLFPKIESMIDCMSETDARIAVITETWLRDGERLDQDAEDLSAGAGLGMLARNRSTPAANGVTYGGVAVFWQEAHCGLKETKISNPDNFEILACAGNLKGHKRKMCVLACYLPPNYTRARADKALDTITDAVVDLKRRFTDPYLVVTGDFNQ